jgi:hypothetical protein
MGMSSDDRKQILASYIRSPKKRAKFISDWDRGRAELKAQYAAQLGGRS